MTISFEIPQALGQELRTDADDLSREAKEAFRIDLYRQEKIAHHRLAEAMGLDRYETDGVLKRHKVSPGVGADEMRVQATALSDARPR